MERSQAEAAAQALLEPQLREQQVRREALEARRAADAQRDRHRRQAAWFALVGWGLGLVVARLCGWPMVQGTVWGGLAGAVIGLIVTRHLRRRGL